MHHAQIVLYIKYGYETDVIKNQAKPTESPFKFVGQFGVIKKTDSTLKKIQKTASIFNKNRCCMYILTSVFLKTDVKLYSQHRFL